MMGGIIINQEKLINKSNSVNQSKFWIHRVDKSLIKSIESSKKLGAEKKGSKVINNFEPDDKIILFSTLNLDNQQKICYFGFTMVEDIYQNESPLYDHYYCPKKLKLKGIKYFSTPIVAKDIASELTFIKNKNSPYKSLPKEYKEINQEDFNKIIRKTSLTKEYPAYFDSITFILEEFILDSIKGLYTVLKRTENRNQFEIRHFLKILKNFLQEYGVNKSYEEVEEFYAKNVWKLGLKHNPSRDPDKFVYLYNRLGKKRNFSYISLD